jgi:hypothetical protein
MDIIRAGDALVSLVAIVYSFYRGCTLHLTSLTGFQRAEPRGVDYPILSFTLSTSSLLSLHSWQS